MARARRPAAGADRHRGAARRGAERRATCRASPCSTWTTCSARWRAAAACARPRPQRARTLVDEEVAALRPLAGQPGRGAHDHRAARARRRRSSRRCWRENETRWESLSEADRERLRVMARAVVRRLLHEPTLRLKGAVERRLLLRPRAGAARAVRPGGRAPELEGERRGRGHRPRVAPPPARLTRVDEARHPRQRAGAGAGRAGGVGAGRHDVEIVEITTSGDRGLRRPGEDKARFVKEIEEALLRGEIDLAVHSAKDVPGELPEGLAIVGVPERADPRDALCGAAVDRGTARGRGRGHREPATALAAAGAAARPGRARGARQRGHAAAQAGGRRVRRAGAGRRGAGPPGACRGRADRGGGDDARAGAGLPGAGGPRRRRRDARARRRA